MKRSRQLIVSIAFRRSLRSRLVLASGDHAGVEVSIAFRRSLRSRLRSV